MQLQGERILLTGGGGFIGTSLADRLADENRIVLFDNLHRNALALTNLKRHPHVRFIQGDVLDEKKVNQAMRGMTMVVHLASIAGVDAVRAMPVRTMEVALIGTYHVIKAAARQSRLVRFVDFSTSEVFGRYAFGASETEPTTLGTVGEARWTYAVSKLATEHLALSYFRERNLPAVAVRPFNIYGPRQVGLGAVHQFIVRAISNKPISIHNQGNQIRAWCYIDDMVEGICRCLTKKRAIGHTFNIGNPRSAITIFHLAKEIVRLSSSSSPIVFVKKTMKDVELRTPDIEKARKLLGFSPKVDLEEGLLRTIQWYRQKRKAQ